MTVTPNLLLTKIAPNSVTRFTKRPPVTRATQIRTWDFNLVDDEGLSVTFKKVNLTGVDTVTLKDVNGKITAEIE